MASLHPIISSPRTHAERAFTLIELSIVLVIIGLIVGGILTGRDLINAARINSEIAHITRYETAVNTFRTKYNEMPGDFGQAARMISGVTSGHNGNNNGMIAYATFGADSDYRELAYAYEHMSKARIIEGSYDGDPANWMQSAASTIPRSKLSPDLALQLGGALTSTGTTLYGQGITASDANNSISWTPLQFSWMTVKDSYSIDAKMDDGEPDRGRFFTINSDAEDGSAPGSTCIAGKYNITDGTPSYRMSSTPADCLSVYIFK